MQHRLVVTYVLGQPIGPIFKGQACPLNMGPTGCPETTVTNYQPYCVTAQKSEDLTITFFKKLLRWLILLTKLAALICSQETYI
jgi:hypothetical protein